jgi:hypothetical protein
MTTGPDEAAPPPTPAARHQPGSSETPLRPIEPPERSRTRIELVRDCASVQHLYPLGGSVAATAGRADDGGLFRLALLLEGVADEDTISGDETASLRLLERTRTNDTVRRSTGLTLRTPLRSPERLREVFERRSMREATEPGSRNTRRWR